MKEITMFGLRVIMLTLSCLSLAVHSRQVAENNLATIMQKVEALIDKRLEEFGKTIDAVIGEIKDIKQNEQQRKELDRKMDDVIEEIENMKQTEEKKKVVQNSTDLEERVSALEIQMILVEDEMSDVKLGLTAVADNVDELQEAENVQNENILFLEQEVSIVLPFTD